jgi:hypothetical protein
MEDVAGAALSRRGPRDTAAAPSDLASTPVPPPVEGLAGLASWWDAREATRQAEGAVTAGAPRSAAEWSVLDEPANKAVRAAEGAVEGAPLVRVSLRSALEELLLGEARASGIEVHP